MQFAWNARKYRNACFYNKIFERGLIGINSARYLCVLLYFVSINRELNCRIIKWKKSNWKNLKFFAYETYILPIFFNAMHKFL